MPRKVKIEGGFVPLPHNLMESEAYKSLKTTAKVAFLYFLRDKKSGHQTDVTLTCSQAQRYRVCQSPSSFAKAKRQLVKHGFLDPVDGGGLNAPAIFRLSDRWKHFGTDRFNDVLYKSGVGSKYFATAMKDSDKKKKVLVARYPKRKPDSVIGRTL